jgi:hypothetical protein
MRVRFHTVDANHEVHEATLEEWAEWFEKADRRVALTEVNGLVVSTVAVGALPAFTGKPEVFETMVFPKDSMSEVAMERARTWAEAEEVHARMVEQARTGIFD